MTNARPAVQKSVKRGSMVVKTPDELKAAEAACRGFIKTETEQAAKNTIKRVKDRAKDYANRSGTATFAFRVNFWLPNSVDYVQYYDYVGNPGNPDDDERKFAIDEHVVMFIEILKNLQEANTGIELEPLYNKKTGILDEVRVRTSPKKK